MLTTTRGLFVHSILLVHGCLAPRAHKLEKRLRKSVASIGEELIKQIGLCRVHVFGFDGAKLLRKGKPTLNEIVRDLLNDVKGIKVRLHSHPFCGDAEPCHRTEAGL